MTPTRPRTEMDRILALERGLLSRRATVLDSPYAPYLRRPQVDALVEWVRALSSTTEYGPPGGAYLLGCGAGKTLLSLLLPAVAEDILGRPVRTLHLVPAALVEQMHGDLARWHDAGFPVPPSDDPSWVLRSHEGLSAPSGRHTLASLAPDLVVLDEAHAYADPESGRWRRITEYLRTRPETRVVILSGTLTWRSLRQCRHLLLAALRGWCPLPADRSLEHWAAVIDVGSEPCADDYRALAPLVQWHEEIEEPGPFSDGTPAAARRAYRSRLTSCPGVVLTSDVEVPVSLRIEAWTPSTPTPPAIAAAVRRLEGDWELPDGTELVSALEVARHGATIPLGLYLRWIQETIDPDWLSRRRAWAGVVRALVAYAGHRYQTPAAVETAARAGHLDATAMRTWARWAEVEGAPGPMTEAVPIGDAEEYLYELIAEWMTREASRGLVWVSTPALGALVCRAMGLSPAGYRGAGSTPPWGGPAVVSIRVHGRGWDGAPRAGYSRALVLEPPASAATWEQLISRHHRSGATEDVTVTVFSPTTHGKKALRSGLAGARYIEETTGARQRLLLADWVGMSRDIVTSEDDILTDSDTHDDTD